MRRSSAHADKHGGSAFALAWSRWLLATLVRGLRSRRLCSADAAAQAVEARPGSASPWSDEPGQGVRVGMSCVARPPRRPVFARAIASSGSRRISVVRAQDVIRVVCGPTPAGATVDIGFLRAGKEQSGAHRARGHAVRRTIWSGWISSARSRRTWRDVGASADACRRRSPRSGGRSSSSTSGRRGAGRAASSCRSSSALQARYGAQGLDVLGVTTEDAENVALFAQRMPTSATPSPSIKHGQTTRSYGVGSLPTLFVIDKRGVVRDVAVGYDEGRTRGSRTAPQSCSPSRPPADRCRGYTARWPIRARSSRVLDELLWSLRREGFADRHLAGDRRRSARCSAVGLETARHGPRGMACVVVQRARERAASTRRSTRSSRRSRAVRRGRSGSGSQAQGFPQTSSTSSGPSSRGSPAPATWRASLETLLQRGAELDSPPRSLGPAADARRRIAASSSASSLIGVQQMGQAARLPVARHASRSRSCDALGDAAGTLSRTLCQELERCRGGHPRVRERDPPSARHRARGAARATAARTTFATLDRRTRSTRFAAPSAASSSACAGASAFARRRAQRGPHRSPPHAPARHAHRGVPFAPARRARRRDTPSLVILCDVSDSVRAAARFMLEFVYAAHELFERTRSFVFVSELGETTHLFAREPASVALGHACGGGVVSVRAKLELRPRPARLRGAPPARARSRGRPSPSSATAGRTTTTTSAEVLDRIRDALARARLALPRVALAVGDRRQRHAALRVQVHRRSRGPLRAASSKSAARTLLVHR